MQEVSILHVGPDPAYPGGIASVMTVLQRESVGGASRIVASWVPLGKSARARVLLRALKEIAGAPRGTVVHAHMASDGSIARKGLLLAAAKLSGHRTALTIHGSRFAASAAERPRVVKLALGRADLIFVLSPEILSTVQGLIPGANAHLFANPVEAVVEPVRASTRDPTVLFAGEVGLRKGADVLLAAWPAILKDVPSAKLIIAGPSTNFEVPDLAGLTVCGALPREEIRLLVQQSRVVALPSRAEALPMILLEGMGCATPFVSTDVGDIARLAACGAGTLVPTEDPAALASAISRYLTDPLLAEGHGLAGHRACQEQFSPQALDGVARLEYARIARRGAEA